MARKDNILNDFLSHPLIGEKYGFVASAKELTIREGLNSEIPIVKTISLIVDNLENSSPTTDQTLRDIVTKYLNTAAL